MKVLSVLFFVILVSCEPQLDLPHIEKGRDDVEKFSRPEIIVIPNSYPTKKKVAEVEEKSGTSFDFDRDRDQRYGPPYDNSEEEEYRRQQNDDRGRYNDFNNGQRYPASRDRVRFPGNDDANLRNPYPPPQQYPQNVRDRYGNPNYPQSYPPPDYNINNDFPQNQYDLEYERRLRIETEKLRELLADVDRRYSKECTLNVAAQWSFETNVNEVSQLEAVSEF